MNVILFGGTGMVGQGVLRECILAPGVQRILSIARSRSGQQHPKLREAVPNDFYDLSSIESELSGYDACFFTLGVTSAGLNEQQYSHVTYDLTLAAAKPLATLNPGMTFIYVSGAGTDSSESGRVMWARIKGKTENAILRLPFKASYMFRPGFIQPLHGIKSKTKSYQLVYAITAPVLPMLKAIFPRHIATTEEIGRAMLNVARHGFPKSILEAGDIIQVASTIA
jgi:uncharacterized protein YbjT (DUF2867 family)